MKCTVTCPFCWGHLLNGEDKLTYLCLTAPDVSFMGKYDELKNTDCLLPANEFCEQMAKHIGYLQHLLNERKAEMTQGGE